MSKIQAVSLLLFLASCTLDQKKATTDLPEPPLLTGPEMVSVQFKKGLPSSGESLMSVLQDDFSKKALDRDLALIKKYKGLYFEVLGFTDSQECGDKQCDELSLRRAKIVYDWLIENGVHRSSIVDMRGHGDDMPIDTNETEEGRAVNRRVEINIAP